MDWYDIVGVGGIAQKSHWNKSGKVRIEEVSFVKLEAGQRRAV